MTLGASALSLYLIIDIGSQASYALTNHHRLGNLRFYGRLVLGSLSVHLNTSNILDVNRDHRYNSRYVTRSLGQLQMFSSTFYTFLLREVSLWQS